MIVEMVTCLALNIYHEARGEPIDGQYAVSETTINRVYHPDYPDDICSVVYQPSQFSWTRYNPKVKDKRAYHKAKRIAIETLSGTSTKRLSPYVLYYHRLDVLPHWASNRVLEVTIGSHKFYRLW